MVKRPITLPNHKLRLVSKPVPLPLTKDDQAIADNLISYLALAEQKDNDLRPGVGIAAVQLGFLKRMFYLNFHDEHGHKVEELLINPVLEAESSGFAAIQNGEGCLSVKESHPDQQGLVHRKFKVIVSGYSYLQKKHVTITKTGFSAMVIQHELDHLDGKLFIDRINPQDQWGKKEDEVII